MALKIVDDLEKVRKERTFGNQISDREVGNLALKHIVPPDAITVVNTVDIDDLEGNRKHGNYHSAVLDDTMKVVDLEDIVQNNSKDGIEDVPLDGTAVKDISVMSVEKNNREGLLDHVLLVFNVYEPLVIASENSNYNEKTAKDVDSDLGNNKNADSIKEDQKSYQTTKRSITL